MGKPKEFHNESKTDLYKKWGSMRCRVSPKWKYPKFYYLKGITICEEWNSFLVFKKWAIENGYKKGLELDRKDNDLGYCPSNCRFVEKIINTSNRSNTIFITYKGEYVSLTLFAEQNELPRNVYNTIRRRLKNGWETDKAIETPVKNGNFGHKGTVKVINVITSEVFNSVKEASDSINIKANTLSMMLNGSRKNTTNFKKL